MGNWGPEETKLPWMSGHGAPGGADKEKTGRFVFEYEPGEYFWRLQMNVLNAWSFT